MFRNERQASTMWFVPLSLIGMSLWILTVATTSVTIVPENLTFGLMQLMPWYFWIGVVSVALASWFAFQSPRVNWHLCVLILVMIYIWGTACLVEPTARAYDPYYHGATVLKLIELGHTDASREFYFQWPGGFIIGSAVLLVAQTPFASLLRIYPIVNGLIFTVSFYLLSRRTLKDRRIVFGATLFALLGESFLQLFFSPQGIGNAMLPLFLMAYLSVDRPFRVVSFLLFLGIMIIHPLIPFAVLIIISGMLLNSIVLRTDRDFDGRRIFLYATCLLAWFLYTATGGFNIAVGTLSKLSASLFALSRSEVLQMAFFSQPHPEVANIRKGIFGFYILLGLVGAAGELKARRRGEYFSFRTSMLVYPAMLIPVVPYVFNQVDFSTRFLVLAILGASLNFPFRHFLPGESTQTDIHHHDHAKPDREMRAGKLDMRYKLGILLVMILSLSVLGLATMYAEESYLMSPQSTLAGAQFVASSIGSNTIVFTDLVDYMFFNTKIDRGKLATASWDVKVAYDLHSIKRSDIICFRIESRVRLFYLYRDTTSYPDALDYVDSSGQFARIYDSSTLQAFRNTL